MKALILFLSGVAIIASLSMSFFALYQTQKIGEQNALIASVLLDLEAVVLSNERSLEGNIPSLASTLDRIGQLESTISESNVRLAKLQEELTAQFIAISQRIDSSLPNYVQ